MHIHLLNMFSSESMIVLYFCNLLEQHHPLLVSLPFIRMAYLRRLSPPSVVPVIHHMLCTQRRHSSIPAILDDMKKVYSMRRALKAILLPCTVACAFRILKLGLVRETS